MSAMPFGPRRLPSVSRVWRMVRWRGGSLRRIVAAVDVADLRRRARRRVPRPVFDFVDGGAGDEIALRRNEAALTAVRLVPRSLVDVSHIDTSAVIAGHEVTLPIVLAPVGMTRIAHPDGELAAARAAARAGIPYCLSTMASVSPQVIADHAGGGIRWFQLYPWRDRGASDALLARARAAGFETLVLTVDAPTAGARLRDVRHGLGFPPSVPVRTAMSILRRPRWTLDALTLDPIEFAAISTASADFATQANRLFDPAATLADLDWLRGVWPGKILVKGILDVDDAAAVVAAGADGVILSNHGGRQLENAVTPLEVLGEVRERLGAGTPILIDGGVRAGVHVAAAVAAGADAVLVGRAYLYGLMAGGEAGVDRSIAILRDGLTRTMALLGAPRLADLTTEMVRMPDEG